MINSQIVEYVKNQLARGVAPEVVKTSLLGVGWPAADIDDSMKKAAEGPGQVVPQKPAVEKPLAAAQTSKPTGSPSVTSPVSPSSTSPFSSVSPAGTPASRPVSSPSSVPKSAPSGGSAVNVRDFFGNSGAAGAGRASPAAAPASSPKINAAPVSTPSSSAGQILKESKSGGSKALVIGLACVTILSLGAAIFFFINSRGAQGMAGTSSAKLTELTGKVSSLTAEVDELQKSKQEADDRLASATLAANDLVGEVSFFIPPTVGTGTVAAQQAAFAIKGKLTFDGTKYTLTTPHGIAATVKNSKDEKVSLALRPLVDTAVELAGTHAAGSREVTVTAVNGVSVK